MTLDTEHASPAALRLLREQFGGRGPEDALGREAVHAFEARHGVVLPEPYRTFVAEVTDGTSLGPTDDDGILPLGHLPGDWPDDPAPFSALARVRARSPLRMDGIPLYRLVAGAAVSGLLLLATACSASQPATVAAHPSTRPSATATAAIPSPTEGPAMAWFDNGGGSDFAATSKDLDDAGSALAANDMTKLADACRSLGRDAAAAEKYGPIPDQQAQAHWQRMLTADRVVASDCAKATSSGNLAAMAPAEAELSVGATQMSLLARRLVQLDFHP